MTVDGNSLRCHAHIALGEDALARYASTLANAFWTSLNALSALTLSRLGF